MPTSAHPRNVPGDFYVEDGCCAACGVPDAEAPDLFSWDGLHCFVSRQPSNEAEQTQMVWAMWGTEVDCIRYRGRDAAMLARLASGGLGDLIDHVPTVVASPVYRTKAIVRLASTVTVSPLSLADAFRSHLAATTRYEVAVLDRNNPDYALVSFSWFESTMHGVEFQHGPGATLLCTVRPNPELDASVGIAHVLQPWLKTIAVDTRWLSADEFRAGATGSPWPI